MVRVKGKKSSKTANKRVPKRKSANKTSRKALPLFTVAQLDPFNEAVKGIKVPDESTAPSYTAMSREVKTMGTDGTYGNGITVFRYHPKVSTVGANIGAGNTWSYVASFGSSGSVGNQSTLSSTFGAMRCVAWGLRVTSRLAASTAAGMVHVCEVAEQLDGSTWTYPTSLASMALMPGYKKVPIADLVHDQLLVPGRITDATAFRYINPGTPDVPTDSSVPTSGWTAILVYIESGASVTNAIDVDVVHHWEALPTGNSTPVFAPTDATPYSPAALAATKYVVEKSNMVRVVSETMNDKGFWNEVANTFQAGISIATGLYNGMELLGALLL